MYVQLICRALKGGRSTVVSRLSIVSNKWEQFSLNVNWNRSLSGTYEDQVEELSILLHSVFTPCVVYPNKLYSLFTSTNASALFLRKVMTLLKASKLVSEQNKRKKENYTGSPSVRVKLFWGEVCWSLFLVTDFVLILAMFSSCCSLGNGMWWPKYRL